MISHGKDLKIFACSASQALARGICKELSIPLGSSETGAGENTSSSCSVPPGFTASATEQQAKPRPVSARPSFASSW